MSISKHAWKEKVLRSYGIDVQLKRGWCRIAVSDARQILANEVFLRMMKEIRWNSLI